MTWVSKEEQNKAKQYDLLSYLQQADKENLVKLSGKEYCTKEHSSLKISNGMWHWWSRDQAGKTAVDYLIKVKGMSFPDAVKEVNRAMEGIEPSFSLPESGAKAGRNADKEKRSTLKIPDRDENNEAAIAYLKKRGIKENIINELIEEGLIYQSSPFGNVNFVGFADDGKPGHISFRSTKVDKIRGDSRGSNKAFCFRTECPGAESVHVFESAIDLLSFASISEMRGLDYKTTNLISLSGTAAIALDSFLKKNPEIKNVILHLDNDDAGKKAAVKITGRLRKNYNVFDRPPLEGKDYNDYLCFSLGVSDAKAEYEATDSVREEGKMEEKNELEVIFIEPGKEPRMVTIEDRLEAMQELVGGRIQEYMPYEDEVGLIVNEAGKLRNLELNRAVRDRDGQVIDIIAGPFFITYAPIESESFLPLPDNLKEKYREKFKTPEKFARVNGGIKALPLRERSAEAER